MPELPEVETIRRGLQGVLIGKRIVSVWSDWPKKVEPSLAKINQSVRDKKVLAAERRAKVLILRLSGGKSLLFHLKMSGQLIYQPRRGAAVFGGHPQHGGLDNLPNKFTHHRITFSDKTDLFFNDQRKFGWIKLVDDKDFPIIFSRNGVEPLEKGFTFSVFTKIISRYQNRTIKQVLLDQALISGIGNIYADESLFVAGIRPDRKVKSLSLTETGQLHKAIKYILALAVKHRGTSTSLYVGHDGQPGNFVKFLNVYGRGKLACKKCKTPIVKIKLNGRGTHFCPSCQK